MNTRGVLRRRRNCNRSVGLPTTRISVTGTLLRRREMCLSLRTADNPILQNLAHYRPSMFLYIWNIVNGGRQLQRMTTRKTRNVHFRPPWEDASFSQDSRCWPSYRAVRVSASSQKVLRYSIIYIHVYTTVTSLRTVTQRYPLLYIRLTTIILLRHRHVDFRTIYLVLCS